MTFEAFRDVYFLENRRENLNLNVVLVVVQIVQQHFRARPLLFYGAGKHILTIALGSSSITIRIINRWYHSRASSHSHYGNNFINRWTLSDRVHLQHCIALRVKVRGDGLFVF